MTASALRWARASLSAAAAARCWDAARANQAARSALRAFASASSRLRPAVRRRAVAAQTAWGATRAARLRFEAIDHDVLPAALQSADLTRLAYREGKVDIFRLLDAERLLTEAEVARADAYEAWGTAHADLLRATARDGP